MALTMCSFFCPLLEHPIFHGRVLPQLVHEMTQPLKVGKRGPIAPVLQDPTMRLTLAPCQSYAY